MNKTVLILKHEFLHVVKSKGFVILTLAFPMIALLAIGIYQIVQGMDTQRDAVTVGYVDEMGIFNSYTQWNRIELIPFATPEKATDALLEEENVATATAFLLRLGICFLHEVGIGLSEPRR